MQADPIQEWQRLSEHYRAMSDEELIELAEDLGSLTEIAQQVLSGEMRSRGLGDADPRGGLRRNAEGVGLQNSQAAELPSNPDLAGNGGNPPREYTWKTPLCECETQEEARRRSEMLRRASIESWIEAPGTNGRYGAFDLTYPRILVAADQLEQAREVAARPIPQDIIEESKAEVPEFEMPQCPKCSAVDLVLESVEPSNLWRCEACGELWKEPPVASSDNIGEEK
jgi:hypothetical protein